MIIMIPMFKTVVAIVTTERQQPIPVDNVHTNPISIVLRMMVIVVVIVVPVGLDVGCDDGCLDGCNDGCLDGCLDGCDEGFGK